MYDNQQYNQSDNYTTPPNYYMSVSQPVARPNNKAKFIIIGLIILSIIGFIALIAFLINKNQSSSILSGKVITPTLEIYASLSEGMPLNDVQSTAKSIDDKAEITMSEGFGIIKIPDTSESITFYYLDKNNETTAEASNDEILSTSAEELLSEEEVVNTGLDLENTEGLEEPSKTYKSNRGYDFVYLYEMGEYNLYISGDEENLFQYYDGVNIFEFSTKQEAINTYLSPLIE